jgi:hypothetical protein
LSLFLHSSSSSPIPFLLLNTFYPPLFWDWVASNRWGCLNFIEGVKDIERMTSSSSSPPTAKSMKFCSSVFYIPVTSLAHKNNDDVKDRNVFSCVKMQSKRLVMKYLNNK